MDVLIRAQSAPRQRRPWPHRWPLRAKRTLELAFWILSMSEASGPWAEACATTSATPSASSSARLLLLHPLQLCILASSTKAPRLSSCLFVAGVCCFR